MNTDKNPVTFGSACAVSETIVYVASFPDDINEDIDFTRLFVLNIETQEKWFHHDLNGETIISVAVKYNHTERECYAMAENGFIERFNSSIQINENIFPKELTTNGGLMSIRQIGESMYACGSGNQVYRRSNDIWLRIGHPIREQALEKLGDIIKHVKEETDSGDVDILEITKKMGDITLLEDISGTSDNDIYTCGSNGVIWHWNGVEWKKVGSGTRQHLHGIHCASADDIFIVGHNGTLLKGNKKTGFHRMHTGKMGINFWSIRRFNKALYIGTTNGIVRATKDEIGFFTPEISGIPNDFSVAAIDYFKDTLWIIADKFVLRNSHDKWELINHPDNT